MSEQTKPDFNPYLAENMPEGGGLTREVAVTSAKFVKRQMGKDGTAVDKEGKPLIFIGLEIKGITVGKEREDRYEYSGGKKGTPSPDGEMLLDEHGAPAKVYKTSNLGKALDSLRAGGFDPAALYPRVSVLVGGRITFDGRDKLGADGKPKTHQYEGKTYNDIEWWPTNFTPGAARAAGNGGVDLSSKAEDAVVAALTAAGGTLARKDLIRALGAQLKGDADAIKVTTMVTRADFLSGARPWVFDPETSTLTLGE